MILLRTVSVILLIAGALVSTPAQETVPKAALQVPKTSAPIKVVVCGTSITTGRGAEKDGGKGWVELLGDQEGYTVINEAQGSSRVAFPIAGRRDPEALYDLDVTADSVLATFKFTNKTLAEIGITDVGITFSFIIADDVTGISAPIYTVDSIVDANTITVASVSDSVRFTADYIADTSVKGIIEKPTPVTAASLSASAAELQRLATIGGFNYADYGYESRIISNNPDILIIDHMYNDGAENILGIGSLTSRKRSEYLGALNYVIDKAQAQNPYIRVVLVTNFSPYRGNNLPAEQHMLDQRVAMISLGQQRCIPVIDLMFKMGVQPGVNWDGRDPGIAEGGGLVIDATHPGRILHKRIYKEILAEFLKLAE